MPTPVGNLEDMTFRAIKVLKEVDLILAEDTRPSGILLNHFEIKNAMQSHHKFNEHKTVESVVNKIKGGASVALISDAGTPGISDPGFLVVRECVRNGIEVQCLPGPTFQRKAFARHSASDSCQSTLTASLRQRLAEIRKDPDPPASCPPHPHMFYYRTSRLPP